MFRASFAADDYVSESSDQKISPLDNVYSYFMFMLPIEEYLSRRPGGKCKTIYTTTLMAYIIVFLSFFLQGILLYAIMKQTVLKFETWKESVYMEKGECMQSDSLCLWNAESDTFSCAPPTIQLSGRWEELDTDGDGVWTIDEVRDRRDDLKCKYGVDPLEVFNVFKKFLLNREKIIWIEPELREGKQIREPYFRYAAGDIIMCGYRSEDMCANLLQRGVFDEPLKHGTVPRVGKTIDSALEYCWDLLSDQGTCVRTLPSTYSVWRRSSEDQCGSAEYSPMVYKHPKSGERKSMLSVDYSTRQEYKHADKSSIYLIYKSSIIAIYLFAMFEELRAIGLAALWCKEFAAAKPDQDPVMAERNDDGEETYEIKGISTHHRVQMTIITILRFIMLIVLTMVGLSFLLKETDYIDLLLNGLGLIFVVEISNLCYGQLLDASMREKCEAIVPMKVPFAGMACLKEDPAMRDLCWIGLILMSLIGIVSYNYYGMVAPVTDALKCTCISDGKKCVEAHKFDKAFWDQYWMQDLPTVLSEIAALEKANLTASGEGAAAPAPAEASPSSDDATATFSSDGARTASNVAGRSGASMQSMMARAEGRSDQPSTWTTPLEAFLFLLGPSWGACSSLVSLVLDPWIRKRPHPQGPETDTFPSQPDPDAPELYDASAATRRKPMKVIYHKKPPHRGRE